MLLGDLHIRRIKNILKRMNDSIADGTTNEENWKEIDEMIERL